MRTRRLHISLAISLLLLLAQHGAILHELSHICRVGNVEVHLQPDSGLQKACELCLAYSQLATPASHTVHAVAFEPAACAASFDHPCAAIPADVPTARSRGPPLQS
jgi:hypothetical protein